MTLSIVSLFCDNDYTLVPALVAQIHKNVKIPHEIILVDNRSNKADIPLNVDNAQIVKYAPGPMILQGRRYGFSLAKGDYVWFIDADDEVLEVSEHLKFFTILPDGAPVDILCFNFSSDVLNTSITKDAILKAPINILTGLTYSNALWNKWFKRSVVEDAYNTYIQPNVTDDCYFSEDLCIYTACLLAAKTLHAIPSAPLYRFRSTFGGSCSGRNIISKAQFMKCIRGYNTANTLLKNILANQPNVYDRIYKNNCEYLIRKVFLAHDLSLKKECMQELHKIMPSQDIIAAWQGLYICKDAQNAYTPMFEEFNTEVINELN